MNTDKAQLEIVEIAKICSNNSGGNYTETRSYAGCTATVVLITPDEIYCCNAGDSRTVLS